MDRKVQMRKKFLAKYTCLYSDLLQALKTEHKIWQLWVLNIGGLNFCVRCIPLWESGEREWSAEPAGLTCCQSVHLHRLMA